MERDFWVLLAMEMDLPEIINTCLTSKKIDLYVCKNDFFWLNKVKKDFGLSITKTKAKSYYFELYNLLKKYTPVEIWNQGIDEKRIDKVLLAIHKNINLTELFKDRRTFILFIKRILDFYDTVTKTAQQVIIFTFLFDKVFPKAYEMGILQDLGDKFHRILYDKLTFYKDHPEIRQLYKKWEPFYKDLLNFRK